MLAARLQEHWERLARSDPYFAVLRDARYHRDRLTDAALDDFFASGEAHLEQVFTTVRERLGISLQPERALDFGCGVGRVTIPLAARARSVVAVDTSDTMLHEAAGHCARRGVTNVEFVLADARLTALRGTFDFVHSYIVFQHIPWREGRPILARLIALLREGGVAALHVIYAERTGRAVRALEWAQRSVPLAHEVMNLLRGRSPRTPLIEMNCYALTMVLGLLQAEACDACHLQFTRHGAYDGVLLFFQKGRSGTW